MPWSDLRFESKALSHQSYDAWVRKVLEDFSVLGKMLKVGVKTALDCSWLLLLSRHHEDLEFLISGWRVESQMIFSFMVKF